MRAIPILPIALAALVGCASAHVTSDWDRNARFGSYHSYAWMETPRMQAMQHATLFDRRLRSAVEAELAAKGFRKSESGDEADVLLVYDAGMREKLDVQSRGVAGQRLDVREYREGSLVIDVVDATTMSLVWRGTADAEIRGPDQSGEKITKAVQKMFGRFPTS